MGNDLFNESTLHAFFYFILTLNERCEQITVLHFPYAYVYGHLSALYMLYNSIILYESSTISTRKFVDFPGVFVTKF